MNFPKNIHNLQSKQLMTFYIFFLVIFNVFSLHLDSPNTHQLDNIAHFETTIQNNKSSKYLAEQNLNYIQQLIRLINNELSLLQDTYKKIEIMPDVKMVGNQGQVINCKDVSWQDKKNIQSSLYHVNTDIWELYFEIQKYMNHGGETNQSVRQYQDFKKRKINLQEKQITYCPIPIVSQDRNPLRNVQLNSFNDISTNKYISNLAASQNWSYGSLSSVEYNKKQFQFLLENDIILCPKDKPFFSNEKCIACAKDQIFFLNSSECKKCSEKQFFDVKTHTCKEKALKQCPGNQIYNVKTNKCQCPSGLTFFNVQNCQSCFIPNYWNKESKICQSCPKGMFYSIKSQSCQACQIDRNHISSLAGCHQQCTLAKPFYNGQQCINCPQIYNHDSGKCQKCPQPLFYNADKGICTNETIIKRVINCQQGYVYNEQNGQCLRKDLQMCPETYIYNQILKICECPSSLPYDTGSRCIACNPPNFWNAQRRTCSACDVDEYFDYTVQKCFKCPVQYPVVIENRCSQCPKQMQYDQQSKQCVLSSHFCPLTYIWNEKAKRCVCPQDRPISTIKGCSVSCPLGQKWSNNLNACVFQMDAVVLNTTKPTQPIKPTKPVENNFIEPTSIPSQSNFIAPKSIPQNLHFCKQGQIWNETSQQCTCLPDRPHKTSEGCIQCYRPMQWSPTQQKCVYYNDTQFDQSKKCKSNFIYDYLTDSCICPKDKPFSNDEQCVSCYLPMYWSYIQKECIYCPLNQYFNTLNRKCQKCPISKPLLVNHVCQPCPTGTRYNQHTFTCEKIQCLGQSIYTPQKDDCICNIRKRPFYNGRSCISCQAPYRWDIESRTCIGKSQTIQRSTVKQSGSTNETQSYVLDPVVLPSV